LVSGFSPSGVSLSGVSPSFPLGVSSSGAPISIGVLAFPAISFNAAAIFYNLSIKSSTSPNVIEIGIFFLSSMIIRSFIIVSINLEVLFVSSAVPIAIISD